MAHKTKTEWDASGLDLTQYLQSGDSVDEDIVDYFIGVLPPACMSSRCIQIGEPCRHNEKGQPMFSTLQSVGVQWFYTGVQTTPKGERYEYIE